MNIKDFEEEELKAWGVYLPSYVSDLIAGNILLDSFIENIISFRNSEFYTGNNPKYKQLKTP